MARRASRLSAPLSVEGRGLEPELFNLFIGEDARPRLEGFALGAFEREGAAAISIDGVEDDLRMLPGLVLGLSDIEWTAPDVAEVDVLSAYRQLSR